MVKNCDDMLSSFHLIPERNDRGTDGRTDGQTDFLYQYRASVCWRRIKNGESCQQHKRVSWALLISMSKAHDTLSRNRYQKTCTGFLHRVEQCSNPYWISVPEQIGIELHDTPAGNRYGFSGTGFWIVYDGPKWREDRCWSAVEWREDRDAGRRWSQWTLSVYCVGVWDPRW